MWLCVTRHYSISALDLKHIFCNIFFKYIFSYIGQIGWLGWLGTIPSQPPTSKIYLLQYILQMNLLIYRSNLSSGKRLFYLNPQPQTYSGSNIFSVGSNIFSDWDDRTLSHLSPRPKYIFFRERTMNYTRSRFAKEKPISEIWYTGGLGWNWAASYLRPQSQTYISDLRVKDIFIQRTAGEILRTQPWTKDKGHLRDFIYFDGVFFVAKDFKSLTFELTMLILCHLLQSLPSYIISIYSLHIWNDW